MLCALSTDVVVVEIEGLKGRILLEGLAEVLGGLCVESVVAKAANGGEIGVSAAANSRKFDRVRRT